MLSLTLVAILIMVIPILLMVIIGILGIRDGLKNGFPKYTDDSFMSDDDSLGGGHCTTTNPDGDFSSPFSSQWEDGSMW